MKPRFAAKIALSGLALALMLPFGAAQARDVLNEVDPRTAFTSVSRNYPSMDATYVRTGTERDIAQLRVLAPGQTQAQVEQVIGQPAYRYGEASFEHLLSLPLTGRDRLICQYRTFYDEEGTLERGVWRRPQCADLARGAGN